MESFGEFILVANKSFNVRWKVAGEFAEIVIFQLLLTIIFKERW